MTTALLLVSTAHLLPLFAVWLLCAATIAAVCLINRWRIRSHDDRGS